MAVTTTSCPLDTKLRMHRSFLDVEATRSNFRAELSATKNRRLTIVFKLNAIMLPECGGAQSMVVWVAAGCLCLMPAKSKVHPNAKGLEFRTDY